MPKRKLSAGTIGSLRHTGGGTATLYWHTGSPGLALAVTASGKKSWRFRERKRNPRTFVIGTWPEMSLSAACRRADELRNEGSAVDASTATVAQVVERYLAEHRTKNKKIPAGECRNISRRCRWIVDTFGRHRLATLDVPTLAAGFRQIEDTPGRHDNTRMVLISIYNFAGVPHPMKAIKRVWNAYKKRGLEEREVAEILAAVRKDHNVVARTLLLVSYELAARPGELASVQWADVDLRRRTLVIRAPRTPGEALTRARVSKTGRDLMYDISDRVVDLLRELHAVTLPIRAKHRSDYVFCTQKGNPHYSYHTAWQRIRATVGYDDVRWYDVCRHGRATQWMAAGVPLQDVSALLQHRDVSTTSLYLDSTRNRRKAAINLPPPSVRENDPDA